MTQVPIQLGLRDIDMETHNITSKSDYVYNRMKNLMIRLIDAVNAIDPSLHAYVELFTNYEREVIFHDTKFLIQYDGLRQGDNLFQAHWRLIWRDVAIQWYKHPKRCIEATRELSHAEEELLVAEFKESMAGFVKPQPKRERSAEQEMVAAERLSEKLQRNATSGKMLTRSISGGIYEFPDHQPNLGPHRMTRGAYGDYQAASLSAGPTVQAAWERIKSEGIEFITEDQKTKAEKMGIGDLSVMFMYPHEIKAFDFSEIRPKGQSIAEEVAELPTLQTVLETFDGISNTILPSIRPGMSLKLTPQAYVDGLRQHERREKFMLAPTPDDVKANLAAVLDSYTVKDTPKPSGVGCAPEYFITRDYPRAQPKMMAFLIKFAFYMHYKKDSPL